MNITIDKAILHALDPASGMPVISQTCMMLDQESREFLETHLLKCIESDEAQAGLIRLESGFGQKMSALSERILGAPASSVAPWEDVVDGGMEEMEVGPDDVEEAFMEESRGLAEQIYQILSSNPEVPAGDLICMLATDSMGYKYFAALKMNYHDGFSHYYMNGTLSIVGQRVLLPGVGRKLEEAFVVCLSNPCQLDVRIIEKKYLMMDETREAYLSSRILGCMPEISEKSKLMAVKKAVQKANKEVLGDKKLVEQELLSRIHGVLMEEEAPTIGELCQQVFRDYPQVTPMVEERLAADNIDPEATVQVQASTVKRFEKQSVKTPDGIEVKIPADLYQDSNAVEFINNPDGTISLLIKNILL